MIRAVSIVAFAFGALIYTLIFAIWWVGEYRGYFISASAVEKVTFGLQSVFVPGAPPLLIALYFLVLKKTARENLAGLLWLLVFIPLHYFVCAITAHRPPIEWVPAQLLELAAAIAVVFLWAKKQSNKSSETHPLHLQSEPPPKPHG